MSRCRQKRATTKTQLLRQRTCTVHDAKSIHTHMTEADVTSGMSTVSSPVPQEEQVQAPSESTEAAFPTTDHATVRDDTSDPIEADSSIIASQVPSTCDEDTGSLSYSRFISPAFQKHFFWPEKKDTGSKKRRKQEKLPSAVSSPKWRDHYQAKQDKRVTKGPNSNERRRERREKLRRRPRKDNRSSY